MREDIKILSLDCSEFICPICCQVFNKPIKTSCGHNFCIGCITKWKQKKKQCPCCRKVYSNDSFYQTDEIMAQKVEVLEITCLKCNNWNGQIKELKTHRLDQCRPFQSENQSIQYQIIEDEPEDRIQAVWNEILSIIEQQNQKKLFEVDKEDMLFEEIPVKQKKIIKNRKRKVNKNQAYQDDSDVQFLQERDIIKLKQSKNYKTKQITKRVKFQNNFLNEITKKKYKTETIQFFASLINYQNYILLNKQITNQF